MKHEAPRGLLPMIKGAKVGILQAMWYRENTEKMVTKCAEILLGSGCSKPEFHQIPGSLELPLAAQTLARLHAPRYEVLICFGAVIKGDTLHFELVSGECARGLMKVSLDEDIPIISEVLACSSLDQLKARCADDTTNKGIEAAMAAWEIVAWRRSLGCERQEKSVLSIAGS